MKKNNWEQQLNGQRTDTIVEDIVLPSLNNMFVDGPINTKKGLNLC